MFLTNSTQLNAHTSTVFFFFFNRQHREWFCIPEYTNHKARFRDVILKCEVNLGKQLHLEKCGDSTLTFEKIIQMGYDSTMIPRERGFEHVVYRKEQVLKIQVHNDTINLSNFWFLVSLFLIISLGVLLTLQRILT